MKETIECESIGYNFNLIEMSEHITITVCSVDSLDVLISKTDYRLVIKDVGLQSDIQLIIDAFDSVIRTVYFIDVLEYFKFAKIHYPKLSIIDWLKRIHKTKQEFNINKELEYCIVFTEKEI